MCRISLLQGDFNGQLEDIVTYITKAQANGSNVPVELYQSNQLSIVLSRFAVTSSDCGAGTFPLESEDLGRFVIAYNGEVFSYRGRQFKSTDRCPTDVHFALEIIESGNGIDGLMHFLKYADLQGTFVIYDKKTDTRYVVTDQLNTAGCFYAEYKGKVIVAQEYPIINGVLEMINAPANIPINIVPNGAILTIHGRGETRLQSYRPYSDEVWSGQTNNHISALAKGFDNILAQAIIVRIPATGDVGVLCSGGVDSTYILHHTYNYLRDRGQLNRLKIFTLGAEQIDGLPNEENDLYNVRKLLPHYGLNPDTDLIVIPINEVQIDQLLRSDVFTNNPRLITPNPAQTQIRHAVRMSSVPNFIATTQPQINVLLTGDFADEIFGGYNSMHTGDVAGLVKNVRSKLKQLPLNDAGRVMLASMYGTKTLGAEHPIEIRSPFSSHLVLDFITRLSPELLVGVIDGQIQPKYFLRVCAIEAGLPTDIALRRKIPFNQGGTGIRNGSNSSTELAAARDFISETELAAFSSANSALLSQLGIDVTREGQYEVIAFVKAAKDAGLQRLALGNALPTKMRDSNYSTNAILPYDRTLLPSYSKQMGMTKSHPQ